MSSLARAILTAVLAAVLSTGQLVSPPVAAADVTVLCRGYTGCAKLGMSDGGYGRASGTMYWRMYAGHNCTNYAAFRMVQSGMPNVRPWDGGGNATYWGTSMPKITDDVPTVGSVAWWRAGVHPAGSAGHVAYVERIVDANTIIISQDSWGGDFSWARVTRGSRGWPSGFIHFNDPSLTNTAVPAVKGVAKVGATLTATPGGWSPAADVSYQWRAGGVDVPGATRPTFTIGAAQLGKRVRVRVTATKVGYPATTVQSALTPPVLPGTLANRTAPAVTGDAVVEGTLTATAGSWEPAPHAVKIEWLADGAPIQGAVGEQLTPGAALTGSALSVRVTASRSGFADVSATSPVTERVRLAEFTSTAAPTLSGTPRLGEVLQLTAGSTLPQGTPTIEWRRGRRIVPGATGTTYQLGTDDLGQRVHARVRWERAGFVPVRVHTSATSRVKATPTVEVRLRPGVGRLRVVADVAVAQGAVLPGHVWVRSGRVRESVPLVDGRANLLLTELRAGTRSLRVTVPPTRTVAAAVWTDEVTIS